MILSYQNISGPSAERTQVKATIATNHSAGSCGQPVIVLADGGALDPMSWVAMGYQVVKATRKDQVELQKMGLL